MFFCYRHWICNCATSHIVPSKIPCLLFGAEVSRIPVDKINIRRIRFVICDLLPLRANLWAKKPPNMLVSQKMILDKQTWKNYILTFMNFQNLLCFYHYQI